jgi:hypothetical protein
LDLLALEQPGDEVYLSIQDGSGSTYYHILHTVETNCTSSRSLSNRCQQGDENRPWGHPYQALAPFLSWIDGYLLYESLKDPVKEVLHEPLTIAENCDAIIPAVARASRALQVFNQIRAQQGERTVEMVLAPLGRDFGWCIATRNRAAQIGVILSSSTPCPEMYWPG